MLSGLRARIAAETSADDPAAAVAPRPAPEVSEAPRAQASNGNVRTIVVASIAFAAGVALTLSLASPGTSGPSEDSTLGRADQVASHSRTGQPLRQPPLPSPPGPGPSALTVPTQAQPQAPALAWPLSMAELSAAERNGQTRDEQEPGYRSIESSPSDPDGDGPAPKQSSAVISPDDDPIADREPTRRRGTGPSGTDPGPRGSATGAWTPSLTPPSAAGSGIGAAARNPAVGGATPNLAGSGSNGQSGSSQNGSSREPDARDSGSDDAPSQKDDPPPQGEEPEPQSEPEPEPIPESQPLNWGPLEYGVGLGLGVSGRTLPGVGPVLELSPFVGVERLHARLTAQYRTPRESKLAGNANAGARYQLAAAGARLCPNAMPRPHRVRVPVCAGVDFGAVIADPIGSDVRNGVGARSFWSAATLEAGVAVQVARRVSLTGAFEAGIALNRPSFVLDGGGSLHEVARFAPRGTIGVQFHRPRAIP